MFRLLVASALVVLLPACGCGGGGDENPKRDGGHVVIPDGGQVPCEGAGYARCDAECVPLEADARHCGACGNACPSGGACVFGSCVCPSGTVKCGDVCANPNTNSDHCGECDSACAEGTACTGAQCVPQCQSGLWKCGADCADFDTDENHCGKCGATCTGNRECHAGKCVCPAGMEVCDGVCVDKLGDEANCGGCGTQCFTGFSCEEGLCTCPAGKTACTASCVDTLTDKNNCGACDQYCHPSQACVNGACVTPCPAGQTRCGTLCVDTQKSSQHCGACNTSCGSLSCVQGQCTTCNSATTDCDGDGWKVSDGDCCDTPSAACGSIPESVNPGALESPTNGIDDNCNGLLDGADQLDTQPCDTAIPSNTSSALDFARAFGICRTTTETPPLSQKTWGVISTHLLQANGAPLTDPKAHSVRSLFGATLKPKEGRALVVLSSGAAADATQTNPGPNGGPSNTSITHSSLGVDIQNCTLPWCIKDWFSAPNPPLKLVNQLPEAPGCAGGGFGTNVANDSVMLVLRLRAPTNARAFQFNGYFLSSEYPEYVCTTFNDQLVALVDTPTGAPPGAVNPVDKNLMTYSYGGKQWPVGINVAKGTGLFKACETQATNLSCWDTDVSTLSCQSGAAELTGTGFDHHFGLGSCLNGGGTGWLVTSGNVRPGEIVELRIALWDVGDHILDSLALLDGFKWLSHPAQPGTTD